jgi:hypothetical protein
VGLTEPYWVRSCATAWFDTGAWVVHLTGDNDPEAENLQHPQYIALPFYDNMAALFNTFAKIQHPRTRISHQIYETQVQRL